MISKINTLGLEGIDPVKIETEVDISSGFPRFEIIGLPDSSIKEAKHRVKRQSKTQESNYNLRE